MSKIRFRLLLWMMLSFALTVNLAWATEGGGSNYSHGTENSFVGFMPAPGGYAMLYGSHERLESLRDQHGDRIDLPFKVTADVLAPRAVWVTNEKVFGGQLAWHTVFPLVTVDADIAGQSQRQTGVGDIVVGTGLGYHYSPSLHYAFGLDVTMPTGSYDKNNLVNVGRNYWSIEPVFALSYIQPKGVNADMKLMYDFNLKNKDTNYRSGQELHMDYSLGYAFGNGWQLGVGGYLYQQTTDDQVANNTVADRKGKAMAIGPSMSYHNDKGFLITLKLQKDYAVENRAAGNALKLKMSIPF